MINIWLDDVCPAPDGFIWIKSVPELINEYFNCILESKQINIISLDNDLGENEAEGYEFLEYLEPRIIQCNYPLPNEIRIHSADPITRERMQQVIDKLYK